MKAKRSLQILRISLDTPYPLINGGRLETFHATRRLSELGHSLDLVVFKIEANADDNYKALQDFCRLHVLPFHGRNSLLNYIRGTVEFFPINYVKYRDAQFLETCFRLLSEEPIDLVLVEFSAMGWYALKIKNEFDIPLVTRWQNIDTLIWQRWYHSQSSPSKKVLGRLQYYFVKSFERKLALASDLCLTIAPQDDVLLQEIAPGCNSRLIPSGVDVQHYAPSESNVEEDSILFLASNYQWHPNLDAVRWLYYDIMPIVWKKAPSVKLFISGKKVNPEMEQWEADGRVFLTGLVPDERDLLKKAHVVVVPMRLGGGIKVRTLTALAMGKPVVTTSYGAEGISGLERGVHAMVKDSAQDFAVAVADVLDDSELSAKLGRQGRQLMLDNYSWEVIGSLWHDALTNVVDQK